MSIVISVIEEHEKTPCAACGDNLCFEKGYGPDFGICSTCAFEIAQLYDLVHGGEASRFAATTARVVSTEVRWEVFRADGFMCKACGATDRPLHVDHITARANGGTNDRDNLQTLCDRCNLKKGAR